MTEVASSYSHLQGHGSVDTAQPQGHGSVDTAQPTTLPGNNHMNSDPGSGGQNEKAVADPVNGESTDSSPSVDIFINNVVCTFSVRCHLNLHRIGLEGWNVEYRREYGKVNMRFRGPRSTATMWSSGKVTMTGNDSADHAKLSARRCARRLQKLGFRGWERCGQWVSAEHVQLSARRCARRLQKLGFRVRFSNYKVVNVLGTCAMPWGIRIANFSREYPREASYEPELHPAVTYRIKTPKATLKIFSTGSITCTAPSVENVQLAIHHIYPLVLPYKKILSAEELAARGARSKNYSQKPPPPQQQQQQRKRFKKDVSNKKDVSDDEEEEVFFEEESGEESEEIDEDMYSSDDSDL